MLPLPVPVPVVTASHGASLLADHVHVAPVVTAKEAGPPSLPIEADVGDIEYVQLTGAPSWSILAVCPPMVSELLRLPWSGFAATVNDTVPAPLPLAPDVIVSHCASARAVQVHPVAVVTVAEPEPPAGPKELGVVATEYV